MGGMGGRYGEIEGGREEGVGEGGKKRVGGAEAWGSGGGRDEGRRGEMRERGRWGGGRCGAHPAYVFQFSRKRRKR